MSAPLADELPPPLRLAIAYAPRSARASWTALLVLDRRLARAALGASEPLLGQMRLAWWRDRFRSPAREWPAGEPLLAALAGFDRERAALERLVDGWERVLGGEADGEAIAALMEARSQAIVSLARILGCGDALDPVAMAARAWSRCDLAATGDDLSASSPARAVRLPRPMRPLTVLAGLAARTDPARGLRGFLRIVRLGLFGR